jgi:hypothetical protein
MHDKPAVAVFRILVKLIRVVSEKIETWCEGARHLARRRDRRERVGDFADDWFRSEVLIVWHCPSPRLSGDQKNDSCVNEYALVVC